MNTGPASVWVTTDTLRYIYDGMRVIQERVGDFPTVSYTRGTDLSGSLEGAGGIGGLLSRTANSQLPSTNAHAFYHADGNGNITYLVSSSQALAARYRYDPYGNTISSSGGLASANTYRFSSKEIIPTWNLYYYGYRFYDPNLQRWPNRDPLGELGSRVLQRQRAGGTRIALLEDSNLYYAFSNDPINRIDPDGRCVP